MNKSNSRRYPCHIPEQLYQTMKTFERNTGIPRDYLVQAIFNHVINQKNGTVKAIVEQALAYQQADVQRLSGDVNFFESPSDTEAKMVQRAKVADKAIDSIKPKSTSDKTD